MSSVMGLSELVPAAAVQLLADADEFAVEVEWVGAANSSRAGYLITPDGYLVVGVSAQ